MHLKKLINEINFLNHIQARVLVVQELIVMALVVGVIVIPRVVIKVIDRDRV